MQKQNINKTESGNKQKGYFWYAAVAIFMIALIVIGAVLFLSKVTETSFIEAKIGDETYSLELLDTEAKRVKGLSERNGLDQNNGMLFDFKQDGDWRIWMYRMRFNIDIAWLNTDKQIIYIKSDASPDDYPERYVADRPSRYVIEINAGEFERLGVKPGDFIRF